MSKTTQDLAEQVLIELGRADAEDPAASPTDIATVKTRYSSIYAEMSDREWTFWDENAIDDRVFDALTQYIAFRVRKSFGVDYNPDDALTRLQAMATRDSNTFPTPAEFF